MHACMTKHMKGNVSDKKMRICENNMFVWMEHI